MTEAHLVKRAVQLKPKDQDPVFYSLLCGFILNMQVIFLSFPGAKNWQMTKVYEIISMVPYGSYIL